MSDPPVGRTLQPVQYFWELRHFCLRLVQDPAYTLWQRLFVLGMFCKKLEDLVHKGRADLIPQLLREYARIAVEGRLQSALESLPVRIDPQLKMIFEVVRTYLQKKSASQPRLKECLDEFFSGLQSQPDASSESTVTAYSTAYEKHYAPFIARHPYLLENYLLNYMFRTQFPLGAEHESKTSPLDQYVFMCLEFAVIKSLLIGISGYYREDFRPDHLIKVVQIITKTIDHNEPLRSAINWDGLSQPITMAALLMN